MNRGIHFRYLLRGRKKLDTSLFETKQLRTLKVLIVDDNADDAVQVENYLKQIGLQTACSISRSQSEFKQAINNFTPELVLFSSSLKGFGLNSALPLLREKHPNVPLIVVARDTNEEEAVELLKQGATDLVVRHHLERLKMAVPRALAEVAEQGRRRNVEHMLITMLQNEAPGSSYLASLSGQKRESLDLQRLNALIPEDKLRLSQNIQLLILEDNPADAQLLVAELTEGGFVPTVRVVDDKVIFLKVLEEFQPDVILADLSLPSFDGIEALNIRNRVCPTVPFIFVSGVMSVDLGIESLKAGVTDYVLKDRMHAVSGVVRRAMREAQERILRQAAEEEAGKVPIMEQREDFVATLTHDLKNPLVGFDGILEAMLRGSTGPLNEEQEKLLGLCRDSNRDLLSLIQNLLEVYRFEKDVDAVTLKTVDFAEIVNRAVAAMKVPASFRGIGIEVHIEADLPILLADSLSIKRLIQNLLDNAIKYSSDNDIVTVSLSNENRFFVLQIENHALPLSAADQEHLFDRFWQGSTGRRRDAGTGLGLYLCKRIVDAHSGFIDYFSKNDETTVLRVKLPS